jgi:O-antigen ligase
LVYGLWFIAIYRKVAINRKALSVLLIFLISIAISMFYSDNWQVGISRLVNFIPAGLFGLYITSKEISFVKKLLIKFLPYTLLGTAILALLQFISGGSMGFWILGERNFDLSTPGIATFNWYGQIFLRPYATFSHPNVLSAYMLTASLILFFLIGLRNRFQIFVQLMTVFTILISFSRSSIAVLGVLGFFVLRKQLIYLVLTAILVLPFLYVRFESALNFDQISITRREELAETAWTISKKSPIVGIGLNNYIPTAATSAFLSGTNRFLQPVHNIFLLTLSETGLVGVVGFGIFLLSPLFFYSDKCLLSKAQIVAFLLVVSFLGMLDHYFLTLPQGQRLLFLLWGISWVRK